MASTLDCIVAARASDLTPVQRLVYVMLAMRSSGDTGKFYGAASLLAADCGLAERTVRYALADLERLGFLTAVHAVGRATVYQPLTPAPGSGVHDADPGTTIRGTPAPGSGDPGTRIRGPRHQDPGTPAPGSDDQGSDQDVDQDHDQDRDQGASPPAPPPATRKRKASKQKALNPYTETWAEAWRELADGAAYPWGRSFHRCVAMTKGLRPDPDSTRLKSDMQTFIRTSTVKSLERYLQRAMDRKRAATLRAAEPEPEAPLVVEPDPPPPEPEPDTRAADRQRELELAREMWRRRPERVVR